MNTYKVKAKDVREGDFLTGLDNGFVFQDPEPNETPYYDGRNVIARGDGLLSIVFHTAEGDEGELIVPEEMPLTVGRDGEPMTDE